MVKLIASDMDHTLLTEKGELPPDFANYIARLEGIGIGFVIASGRPLYTLEHIFSSIKNKLGFIADNGGVVNYKGETLFKSLISPATYQAMVAFIGEKTDGIAILCGLDTAFLPEEARIHENFLRTFYANMMFVPKLDRVAAEVDKVTVYLPDKNSKACYEKIVRPWYGGDFSVTVGDTIWIDIMNHGINKGNAMRVLGDRLHIGASHMMAFGDTYNDIEMLKAVEYSYIVKNAHEDMKGFAKFITDSNDNFGVIKVIDKILHGQKIIGRL
ncbi:MAG: Cof-type HAD-IIB family hydrolase [Spirochaetaceae bacterium]|jgi:Cof subfamily protein (haloacid dehalogenase superfamily)|nr:Cof-type HAD-IIB family hydrolase [Spirochaetaceae bacterium]